MTTSTIAETTDLEMGFRLKLPDSTEIRRKIEAENARLKALLDKLQQNEIIER